jgi:hypothetical protein
MLTAISDRTTMNKRMAPLARRYQVFFGIIAGLAAKHFVVNLQV